MHRRSTGIWGKDLEDEEIIPDYLRLGGRRSGLRRDASVEEITHLIHGSGIRRANPGVQQRLEDATNNAEYLIFGLDIYYGECFGPVASHAG